MANEYRLSSKEVSDLLDTITKVEPYKLKGHSFVPLKGIGKSYCRNCGLVALRNPISDWCVEKGCEYKNHSQYAHAFRKLAGGMEIKY